MSLHRIPLHEVLRRPIEFTVRPMNDVMDIEVPRRPTARHPTTPFVALHHLPPQHRRECAPRALALLVVTHDRIALRSLDHLRFDLRAAHRRPASIARTRDTS